MKVSEVKKYISAILAEAQNGSRKCLTEEERGVILEFLPYHPDFKPEQEWELCLHLRKERGWHCLCVKGIDLNDGIRKCWPISYKNLGKYPEKAERDRRYNACRKSVEPDIIAFRDAANKPSDWEVDHCNPRGFKAIVQDFENRHGTLPTHYDLDQGSHVFEPDVAELFRQFHAERAELQMLSPEEHKQITLERAKGLEIG